MMQRCERKKALFVLHDDAFELVFGPQERADIAELVDFAGPQVTAQQIVADRSVLASVDILITGWGGPVLDEALLASAPRLKAVFHGGGAMGGILTPAVWGRDLIISSAIEANAIPVAEFTLAATILSLKQAWLLSHSTRSQKAFANRDGAPGCYRSTVGLISLGATGRRVAEMLKALDVNVLAFDPFATESLARALRVELVSLKTLFARSDVVSLHTPLFDETRHMIGSEHFELLKPGAAFINTSRGAIVEADALAHAVATRPDVQFVLDVTDPEPPASDSILFSAPNVFLTPHIAGSVGTECRRMGRFVVDEIERFVGGKSPLNRITPEKSENSSHRPAGSRSQMADNHTAVSGA